MPILTILIEDSKTIRDALIPSMAEMADVEVIAIADTAAGAIEALEEHKVSWQLAVLDLFLKEGHGLTVLRACRDRRPNQHVVVLTNYATDDIRRSCAESGADAIFDKSTELEAFFEYLRAL
ncbi:response regulator transcription factor [Polaromonas sp. YR568]|uniref:response regulator n=1 Tax=Polaromonas sp. YR568 TaxID=1855301 RepID=UPI00398BF751